MDLQIVLIILVIGLIAWAHYAPTSFNSAKDKLTSLIKNKVNSTDNTPTTPAGQNTTNTTLLSTTTPTTDTPAPSPTTDTPTTPTTTTQDTPQITTYTQTDICARPHGDYPNYFATQKMGQTCTQQTQPDYACLANPPSWYDGTIDLLKRLSTPNIACCLTDGRCRW